MIEKEYFFKESSRGKRERVREKKNKEKEKVKERIFVGLTGTIIFCAEVLEAHKLSASVARDSLWNGDFYIQDGFLHFFIGKAELGGVVRHIIVSSTRADEIFCVIYMLEEKERKLIKKKTQREEKKIKEDG